MDFNVCLYRYPYIKYEKNKHAKTDNSAFSKYSFVLYEKKKMLLRSNRRWKVNDLEKTVSFIYNKRAMLIIIKETASCLSLSQRKNSKWKIKIKF